MAQTHGRPDFHPGVDYHAPLGTPVYSAFTGTVRVSRFSTSAGNMIAIESGSGSSTVYMHLSRLDVHQGEVAAGQQIGLSGNTGKSDGPHLHFEQHTAVPLFADGVFNHATRTPPCR